MRRTKWGVFLLTVALAACAPAADDEAATNDTAETAAPAPAPAPATPAPGGNVPAGATPEMVAQGQQIFTSTGNCFTCHGADAKGTSLAPNLTDAEWINADGTLDQIANVIRTGVATPKQHPAPMPPMGGASLTPDQVTQVAAYVWSLGGGK